MADRVLILCILSILCFSSVMARTLPPNSYTMLLDVSDSIRKIVDVISGEYGPISMSNQQLEESSSMSWPSPSPPFSFQLRSRSSLHRPRHTDYGSLTLARLDRDAARVESLQTKLNRAIRGLTGSDMEPLDSEFEAQGLEIPVTSGTSQGSGEYFSRVGIGRPPSQVYMVLDTGSDVNWVQCAPCSDCYQQADPIFQPSLSSSYSPLTCDSRQCKSLQTSECRNNKCLYEVSYGDGSFTVGDFATETITLGGSASVDNIAIGCGHNNDGLFIGAAGLIGLGGGSLSFPSQINASSFSYCLVDRDSNSASTLEFNSAQASPNVVTAPLLRNRIIDTFYYVGLTGLSVAGDLLPINPSTFQIDADGDGGVIVDSGTMVTRLPMAAYDALRDAFVRGTRNLPFTDGVALFDTCYDLSSSSAKTVEIPTVSLHFSNGKSLPLPAKSCLIPVDSHGTFCFAFAPTSSSLSIIGNVQQQGTRVSIDLANSIIGFVPNNC